MPTIYAPWEDSPGKGSRDLIMEPANEWGSRELTKYLGGSWGDPYGIFAPEQVSAWKSKAAATYNTGAIEGFDADSFFAPGRSETAFDFSATPFTDFTTQQLQAYLAKGQANAALWGNGEEMWAPKFTEYGGTPYVSWGNQNSSDNGFFDKLSNIVGGALPLIGLAAPALGASIGAGALGAGGALTADALAAEIAGLTGSGVATGGAIGTGAVAGGLGSLGEILNSIPNPFSGGTGASGSGAVTGDALAAEIAGLTGSGVATGGALGTGATAGSSGAGSLGSAASSALGRILGGTATAADWGQILGTVGSTALGVYGSNQQSDALTQIANQSRADRQPFLNKSLEWLNNPSSYMEGIGKPALDATLRALSVQGNPLGNPTSLALAGDIANKNWQNAVTGFGNIGLAGQDSRNSLLANAAQSQSGMYDALGYGLNQLTQPKQSLSDLARAFGITGLA